MRIIDWHAGFVSAMKLELIENEKDLIYEEEHLIANRAQKIDFLIIKNNRNVAIRNPIGSTFGRFNICEYKSPGQSLTYGDFYKVLAYTGLYLYETQGSEEHNASDYTMTFVRESHPYKLFKRLKADGIKVTSDIHGIYELAGNLPFRTQIVVTIEIPDERKSWLRCLTSHGKPSDLANIVSNTLALEEHNKRYADNVMDIFTRANNDLMKEQMEEPIMCKAVDELFAEIFADDIKAMKAEIADKDSVIADKDSLIADKDALIAKLQAELEKYAKGTQ
mgnify:CR=1 FL=1